MTKSELDQIRARANAATPGPWEVVRKRSLTAIAPLPDWVCSWCTPNATFAAHARTDVPALCDALEAAMEALEDLYYAADRRDRTREVRELLDQWRAD